MKIDPGTGPSTVAPDEPAGHPRKSLPALVLGSVGTSPLYAMRDSLLHAGAALF